MTTTRREAPPNRNSRYQYPTHVSSNRNRENPARTAYTGFQESEKVFTQKYVARRENPRMNPSVSANPNKVLVIEYAVSPNKRAQKRPPLVSENSFPTRKATMIKKITGMTAE
jgi:hypothetical protein